jgi:Zn-dependent protease with chaperone function
MLLRAAVSVVLLLGFAVIVVAYIVLLPFGTSWLAYVVSGGNLLVLVAAGLGVGLVVGLLVRSLAPLRETPPLMRAVPVYRDDSPALWHVLDELAARTGTRPPEQVWLDADPDASVSERTKLFGLLPGRRSLRIGLPLVCGLSRAELLAVLAHEFGHYAHGHSRLAALSYRGHVAISRVLSRFARHRANPLGWLFRGYGLLYVAIQHAVSRRQELEADAVMASVAGRAAAQSTLRRLPGLASAWEDFRLEYAGGGLDVDLAPEDVFGGFGKFLEARREELEAAPVRAEARSWWDTHPPIADRLWALESAPDGDTPLAFDVDLLADFAKPVEAMTFSFAGCRRLPWEDLLREAWLVRLDREAEAAFRAMRRAGLPTLDSVLRRAEAGEDPLEELAAANLAPHGLDVVILRAAFGAGSVRFEHRWDELPMPSGADVEAIVDSIFSGGARAALEELGVNLHDRGTGSDRVSATGAFIRGGIADVRLGGELHYLVITDRGLIFVRCRTKTPDGGKQALRQLLEEGHPGALSVREGSVWLPYEEIAEAEVRRAVPIKASIRLTDGTTHEVAATFPGYSHGDSQQVIQRVLARYA